MATSKSLLIAVRVTPEIAAALDRLGANAKLHTPVGPIPLPTRSLTRTEALRIAAEVGLRSLGMLGSDIQYAGSGPQVAATATATTKTAPPPKAPTLPPIKNAVLAALKANEQPGKDLLDVAAVVRALEAQGHERTAIHAELVRLGTAGVDVLELRPDSGNGNERSDDRAIVPKGLDGTPLLTARWKNRPEAVPPQEHDSDALRARFKAAMAAKKTGPSKAAEFTECSERSIRRWLKGEATMTPDDSNAISAHLDSING